MKLYYRLLIIIIFCLFLISSVPLTGKAANVSNVSVDPNPFDRNAIPPDNTTTISYDLTNSALLWLRIYNLFDVLQRTLEEPPGSYTEDSVYGTAGSHNIIWDGTKDDLVTIVPYGTYPFHIDDVSYVKDITTDATYYPYDVVIDPTTDPSSANLTLWVTDTANRLLKSVNSGTNWTQVTYGGNGPALGIAISNNGQIIYVVNNGSAVATKNLYYSPDGGINWYARILPWVTNLNSVPHDVACSTDGQYVYVVDNGTGYKKVYRSIDNGQTWDSGYQPPVGVGGLRGVAVDPNNKNVILLADTANNRVHKAVYDGSGIPTFSIALDNTISSPYQISIDTNGYYWVSSRGNHSVGQYDSQNNLLMLINNGSGSGNYRFNSSTVSLGIFIAPFSGQQYLYVASYNHKKIKIYKYDNWESNGLTDPHIETAVDTTPPAAISDLTTGAVGSNSVNLTWTAPGDDGNDPGKRARSYDVRYSKTPITTGGEFDSATRAANEPTPSLQGNPESFTVTVDESSNKLESNTTYYFAMKSADERPNNSGLSSPNPSGKTGLLFEWNMVSCPKLPSPNDSNSVFGDDAGYDWMWSWQSTWTGSNDTNCASGCKTVGCSPTCYCHPDCDGNWEQITTIVPGEGNFLYSLSTSNPTDADGSEITDPSKTISLNPGWNLIGNPYGTNVNLSDCDVHYTSTKTYADAVTSGWIGNAVYIWNESTYVESHYSTAKLEPWKGYWIMAYYNLDLIIKKP